MGVTGSLVRRTIPTPIRRNLAHAVRDAYWFAVGPLIKHPRLPEAPRAMLFICHGNICRSPFAERLTRRLALEAGLGAMAVASAGLRVSHPRESPREAVEVAKRFGVRLDGHVSQPITAELVEAHDVIVAMEVAHLKALRSSFPRFAERIVLLPLFDPSGADEGRYRRYHIEDPYGGPLSAFDSCFVRIQQSVSGLLERLLAAKR